MTDVQRILAIPPSWVGDMVMCQTVYKTLKQRYPASEIDVLAPNWGRSLLARMPEISQALVSPFLHGELRLKERYQLGARLSRRHYHQAIIMPRSIKSCLVPFFAKIPIRTGYLGEKRWGLLNDIRLLDKQKTPLMVQRMIALALEPGQALPTDIPQPSLQSDTKLQHACIEKFSLKTDSQPILAICPGAEYGPAKRWPAAHYASLAQHYLKQGWQVWIMGSSKEQAIGDSISERLLGDYFNFTGKTTLDEAIELLALSSVIVSNDSGLMHMGAALQKPVVAIYGSSDPHYTPPLNTNARILQLDLSCSPCFKRSCPYHHTRCLTQITPQAVINNINTFNLTEDVST